MDDLIWQVELFINQGIYLKNNTFCLAKHALVHCYMEKIIFLCLTVILMYNKKIAGLLQFVVTNYRFQKMQKSMVKSILMIKMVHI